MKFLPLVAIIFAHLISCTDEKDEPQPAQWYDHQDTMTQLTHINLGVGLEIIQLENAWLYLRCTEGIGSIGDLPCNDTVYFHLYYYDEIIGDTIIDNKSFYKVLDNYSDYEESLKVNPDLCFYYQDSTGVQVWWSKDSLEKNVARISTRFNYLDNFKKLISLNKLTMHHPLQFTICNLVNYPAKIGSIWLYNPDMEWYKEVVAIDSIEFDHKKYFAVKSMLHLCDYYSNKPENCDTVYLWDSTNFPNSQWTTRSNDQEYEFDGKAGFISGFYKSEIISYKPPD
jgi:hypothetical protein